MALNLTPKLESFYGLELWFEIQNYKADALGREEQKGDLETCSRIYNKFLSGPSCEKYVFPTPLMGASLPQDIERECGEIQALIASGSVTSTVFDNLFNFLFTYLNFTTKRVMNVSRTLAHVDPSRMSPRERPMTTGQQPTPMQFLGLSSATSQGNLKSKEAQPRDNADKLTRVGSSGTREGRQVGSEAALLLGTNKDATKKGSSGKLFTREGGTTGRTKKTDTGSHRDRSSIGGVPSHVQIFQHHGDKDANDDGASPNRPNESGSQLDGPSNTPSAPVSAQAKRHTMPDTASYLQSEVASPRSTVTPLATFGDKSVLPARVANTSTGTGSPTVNVVRPTTTTSGTPTAPLSPRQSSGAATMPNAGNATPNAAPLVVNQASEQSETSTSRREKKYSTGTVSSSKSIFGKNAKVRGSNSPSQPSSESSSRGLSSGAPSGALSSSAASSDGTEPVARDFSRLFHLTIIGPQPQVNELAVLMCGRTKGPFYLEDTLVRVCEHPIETAAQYTSPLYIRNPGLVIHCNVSKVREQEKKWSRFKEMQSKPFLLIEVPPLKKEKGSRDPAPNESLANAPPHKSQYCKGSLVLDKSQSSQQKHDALMNTLTKLLRDVSFVQKYTFEMPPHFTPRLWDKFNKFLLANKIATSKKLVDFYYHSLVADAHVTSQPIIVSGVVGSPEPSLAMKVATGLSVAGSEANTSSNNRFTCTLALPNGAFTKKTLIWLETMTVGMESD